jgi:ABC-type polysaccharide/polyol phosphate transport system ATPase subunit
MSVSKIDSEKILEVRNFSITYRSPNVQALSLRDGFVNFFKNPGDYLFNNDDIHLVLDKVSFDVKRGDIIGLIGENGVGKTSLCRYLAGIIDSENIKCNGAIRAIFDTSLSLYPNLSGFENATIIAGLMFPEFTKIEKKQIVAEAMLFSELGEFVHMPLNRYSKGMKSRLYLSLVTSRPAELLILDEIFGSTDIFFSEKFSIRMKEMIKESGAVIVVSHDMGDIRRYCNKLICLFDKKIKYIGEVELGIELFENQKNNDGYK